MKKLMNISEDKRIEITLLLTRKMMINECTLNTKELEALAQSKLSKDRILMTPSDAKWMIDTCKTISALYI